MHGASWLAGAGLVVAVLLMGGPAFALYGPASEHGVLDLRGWNPETDGVVDLSGEWLVSWERLAGAESALPLPQADGRAWTTVTLPAVWNGTELPGGRRMDGWGAATYRLRLLLPPDTPPLTLKVPPAYSTMRVWADGRVVGAAGTPALDAGAEAPVSATRLIALPGGRSSIELAIEVSNHFHFEGGLGKALHLDGNGELARDWQRQLMTNAGVLMSLVTMTLFIAALMRRKSSTAPVFLLLLLLACTLRLACTSELLRIYIPSLPEVWAYRLEYLPIYLFYPIYFFLLRELFPGCLHRAVGRVLMGLSVAGVLLVLLAEPVVFTRFRDVASALLLVSALYFAWRLGVAARRRHRGVLLLGVGVLTFLAAVVHDALMYAHFYESIDLVPYGALVFLFSHALLLGRRVVSALEEVRDLSQKLTALNEGLERQVAERTRALSDKSAMLERFLANFSHEVRTPLNAILGMVRVILRDGGNGNAAGPIRERLLVADNAGRHLMDMLDSILEWSRLEAGWMELEVQPADAVQTVRDAVTLMRPAAEEKGLQLILDTAGVDTPHHWIDPLRLRQVALNLVSNAVKFTERGRVDVTLAAYPAEAGATLMLTVADTGPGVPAAARALIFEPFHRVDGSRRDGTGLGLALVSRLVERMGGSVELRDRAGGGSVFSVTIPTRPAPAPTAPEKRFGALPDPGALDILVVEDAPENQAVMREYLRPGGHRAVYVESGEEALAHLVEQRFDVVLLDMRLRGMDGLEVTRRLRAFPDPDTAMVPIIAVTANTSAEDRALYRDAGVDEVLPKPVDPEALFDALARHAPADPGRAEPALPAFLPADRVRLLATFAEACREVLEVLEDGSPPPERLADVAHRLKGSGATYGFPELSADARALEHLALAVAERRGDTDDSLGAATEALRFRVVAVLRAIDGGDAKAALTMTAAGSIGS
ncbi:ATP-binding protein [Azospirillum soli]|uniref:ATP-binding protein n=1 Tax=Azospirillum soli TaxID=1304799 RepID=UPI001FEA401D|nr:ATP-binding protein [Azospirillum soli]MBP2316914.1 signal transduction histidine kinase/CheY-like chemotaxis protein/HPt (histidine-containing phosphotransfer) domain-containing protein [Azospirillum soli]